MMWCTFKISTANCMTDKQFRSVCTTKLAILRWTNNSPGARPTIWFAGTRLSEQPIQRYCGDCCRDSSRKNSGFTCRIPSDQARFFSKRWLSVSIPKSADYADFTDRKYQSGDTTERRRVARSGLISEHKVVRPSCPDAAPAHLHFRSQS